MFGAGGSSMSGRLGGYQLNPGLAPKSNSYLQNFAAEGAKDYSPEALGYQLNSGYLGPTSPTETSSPDLSQFASGDLSGHGGTATGGTQSADLGNTGVNPNHPGTNPNHPDSTTPSPTGGAQPLPPAINWQTPGWTSNLSALDQSTYNTLKGESDPYKLSPTGFNPLSYGFWGG